MPIIVGATIDFTDYSAPGTPRILNVPSDVNVQDIWDTLSTEAAKLENLSYKKLIDRPASGGKNTLTVTKVVGITLVMNNVQIKFPDEAGPTIRRKITDGNLIAVDHNGDPMPAIAISTFTFAELEFDTSAALIQSNEVVRIEQIVRNKQVTDQADGKLKIRNDADTADEFEAPIFEDAAGLIPYRGTGIERRDRLEAP